MTEIHICFDYSLKKFETSYSGHVHEQLESTKVPYSAAEMKEQSVSDLGLHDLHRICLNTRRIYAISFLSHF